jgi:tetratricopeptide (TPR) repeat protein
VGLFLTALGIVLAGGLFLFHYAAENPVIMTTLDKKPVSEPKTAPLPVNREKSAMNAKPAEARRKTKKSPLDVKSDHNDLQKPPLQELPLPAKQTDAVMALMASAKQHEEKSELASAEADYRKALQLDPESKTARNALDRLKRVMADQRFEQHMSSGISAMQRGEYYTAQEEFIKAKNIKPASPGVEEALAQADAAIRLVLIRDLEKEASVAEQSEDWRHAVEAYLAVLKIDNSLQFAIQGKARSLKRLRMDKRLQYYLDNARTLESDPYLEQAIDLLKEAEAVSPKGPRIDAQIEKFKPLVQIARTPVNIIFKSDNLTDIAIYKKGKLGKFMQKELELRPGTYTIVGVRDGYKDVRQKITIKPEDPQRYITIKCEEEI